MIPKRISLMALGEMLPFASAHADLSSGLLAYYNFEATGAAGLVNQAPGASGFNATRGGTLFSDWAAGDNPSGPGFAGKADFTSTTSGVSDRSTLHVGNALNLDEDRDEFVRVPVSSTDLGVNFTISAWHSLTMGAGNTSNRYHVFETETGFDVSWGTASTAFSTPQASYNYLAYVGEAPNGGFGPTNVLSQLWHHVAYCVSSDETTSTLRLYFNGQLVSTRTVSTSSIAFDAILLGRHRTSATGDRDWDGMIDEVGLWNRSLSANEVIELHERGRAALAVTADLAAANKAFVSVENANPTMGLMFGTGLYEVGEAAFIEASPNLGHVFTSWGAPFDAEAETFSLTVAETVTIAGGFAQDTADGDSDGLTNYQELIVHFTNPNQADSDGDLVNDGAEVNQTQTDPLESQLDAVNYIMANLGGGGPGPGDTVLTRNAETNTLTVKLKAATSTTLDGWSFLTSESPGVTVGNSLGDFLLQVAGPAEEKRFFQLQAVEAE